MLTARTELTDRLLIFGERHLRHVLAEYARHYNGQRPHRPGSYDRHDPTTRSPPASSAVTRRVVLGGLVNEYEPAA